MLRCCIMQDVEAALLPLHCGAEVIIVIIIIIIVSLQRSLWFLCHCIALLSSSVVLIIPVQGVEAALLAMHCAAEVLRSQTLNQLLKSSSSPLRWLMLT